MTLFNNYVYTICNHYNEIPTVFFWLMTLVWLADISVLEECIVSIFRMSVVK